MKKSSDSTNFAILGEQSFIDNSSTSGSRYYHRKEIVWSHKKCNQCDPAFHANYSYNYRVQQLSSSGSTKVKDILNSAPLFAFGNLPGKSI